MKKFIFIALVFLFVFTMAVSCKSEPRYTSEEWEQVQEEKQEREQKNEENIENLERSKDFNKRLSTFFNYLSDNIKIEDKYNDDVNDLTEKFNKTVEISSLEKKKTYAELLAEKYTNYIDDLNKLSVPSFCSNIHSYFLEYLTKQKLYYVRFNLVDDMDDIEELEELKVDADLANNKWSREVDRVYSEFNKEAKELGLQIPFPDVD